MNLELAAERSERDLCVREWPCIRYRIWVETTYDVLFYEELLCQVVVNLVAHIETFVRGDGGGCRTGNSAERPRLEWGSRHVTRESRVA
jgi:hypothetical protein